MTDKLKCPAAVPEPSGGVGGGNGTRVAKKGPNWWLIGGVGLVGLLAFHWMAKSSNDNFYRKLEPVPPNPPVPVPVAPVPRTTQ